MCRLCAVQMRTLHRKYVGSSPRQIGGASIDDDNYDKMKLKIAREYRTGMAVSHIASKFSICETTVRIIVKRLGVESRRRGGQNKIGPLARVDIVNSYLDLKSARAVARVFGISHESVLVIVKSAGVTVLPPGRPNQTIARK